MSVVELYYNLEMGDVRKRVLPGNTCGQLGLVVVDEETYLLSVLIAAPRHLEARMY
jgi:hypothetical protein